MSGSRLGRGRGGRLAVYGACGVVVVLLVVLYRAATSEMARLREINVQCTHQQEALAAQLQVIFEYKVRLEKSLADEKSSIAAVKQELQQRATREKSLRDKDSFEAMQRYNSLKQTYKLLETEHQDLQEECDKHKKQALEESRRLEGTLQELRGKIKLAKDEKEQSMNHLKNKYQELETEKTRLEDKYNDIMKATGNTNSTIDHLKKEVFQLKRELQEAKRSSNKATSPGPSAVSPQSSQQVEQPAMKPDESQKIPQQQPQQVSPPSNLELKAKPLAEPRVNLEESNEAVNEDEDKVGFAQKGPAIVPIGRDEQLPKDVEQKNSLPLPYGFRDKQKLDAARRKDSADKNAEAKAELELEDEEEEGERDEEEEKKQLAPPPNAALDEKLADKRQQPDKAADELFNLQKQVDGILNRV